MFIGLGFRLGGLTTISPQSATGSWDLQQRIYWEDINTLWGSWSGVLGTFKLWEEQSKEYWELESTTNWEDWFETQGSLEMIEEKTSDNWDANSTNWENFE